MKERPPAGFVPVNFGSAGRVLLVMGIVFLLIGGVDYLIGLSALASLVLFLGVGLLVIGGYVILASQERKA